MSAKEACLKHVFNTGTSSDDIGIMFSCTGISSDDTEIIFYCTSSE